MGAPPITGRSFFSKYGDASSRVVRVPHHGERFPWVARPYSPEKKALRGSWSRLPSREPRRGSVVGAPPITGRSFFSKYGDASSRVVRVPHHGERFPWLARPSSPEKKAPRSLWSRLRLLTSVSTAGGS